MGRIICLLAFLYLNGRIMGLNVGEDCSTPEDENGKCIHYRKCPHYTSVLKNITIDHLMPPGVINYLKKAKCGITEKKKLLLCCPMSEVQSAQIEGKDCFTPEEEKGKCIHFRKCPHYTSVLRNISKSHLIPPRIINYLEKAKCGITEDSKLLVCCPMNEVQPTQMEGEEQQHFIIQEEKRKNSTPLSYKERLSDKEIEGLLSSKDEALASKDKDIASKDKEIKKLLSLISLGYEMIPGLGYYKYHGHSVKFANASSTCEKEGAHVVILNSDEEANAVMALKNKFTNLPVWTGIIDAKRNREFKTIFGTPLNETGYSNWEEGEPNNAGGYEFCVSFGYNGVPLNDLPCDIDIPFACEVGL